MHLDGLLTDTESAVDNGISDPGSYLPDILGVNAQWDNEGGAIVVTWIHSVDPQVESYRIWIGGDIFAESGVVGDATLVGMENNENTFSISNQAFPELDNKTTWWIGISAVDDLTFRHEISTVSVAPFGGSDTGNSGTDTGTSAADEKSFLEDLLEPTNLLIAMLLFAILVVLIMLVRGNGGRARRDSMWELQEATWGISNSGWDSNVDPLSQRGQTVQTPSSPPPATPRSGRSLTSGATSTRSPTRPPDR